MEMELREITIRELIEGYSDNGEGGVVGYGGKLDIRPPYQREFVYKDVQRNAVIDTVSKGFPLNVMYWAVRDDGGYEIVDGQQRIVSISRFCDSAFSMKGLFNSKEPLSFGNLPDDKQEEILNYKLMVYVCEGEPSEKLDWFEAINTHGEKLNDQELRNALYHGSWVSDAKKYFSKTQGPAYTKGAKDYMKGIAIRQDYLKTAIDWISEGEISEYMSEHQHNPDADELKAYFERVIDWVNTVFPEYRKEMKGLNWGRLYNTYKGWDYSTPAMEARIHELMADDEVTKKSGIYEYVLSGEDESKERLLSIRAFTDTMKRTVYARQNGKCAETGIEYPIEDMEADHITPWSEGGKTTLENCQMLHKECNRRKGAK